MPDIKFYCPKCRKKLAVDERGAGLTIACPLCHQTIQIPAAASAPVAPAVPAPPPAEVPPKRATQRILESMGMTEEARSLLVERIRTLEEELKELRPRLATLAEGAEQLRAERTADAETLRATQQGLARVERERDEATAAQRAAQAEAASWQQRAESSAQELERAGHVAAHEASRLREQVAELDQTRAAAESALALERTKQEEQAQVAALAREELTRNQALATDLRHQLDRVAAERDEARTAGEQVRQELMAARDDFASQSHIAQRELETLRAGLQEMDAQRRAALAQHEAALQTATAQQRLAEERQAELERGGVERAATERARDEERRAARAEAERLQQELARALAAGEQASGEREAALETAATHQRLAEERQAEVERAGVERAATERARDEERRAARAEAARLQQELARSLAAGEQASREREALVAQRDELAAARAGLETQLAHERATVQHGVDAASALREQLAAEQAARAQTDGDLTALRLQVKTLDEERARLADAVSALDVELLQQKSRETGAPISEARAHHRVEELEAALGHAEAATRIWKTRAAELEAAAAAAPRDARGADVRQHEVQQLREELKRAGATCQILRDEVAMLKQHARSGPRIRLNEAGAVVQTGEAAAALVPEGDVERLQARIDELETSLEDDRSEKKAWLKQRAEVMEDLRDAQAQSAELEQRMNEQERMGRSIAHLEQRLQELRSEAVDAQRHLTELEEMIQQGERGNSLAALPVIPDPAEDTPAARAPDPHHIERLEDGVRALKAEKQAMRARNVVLEQELQSANEQVRELEGRLTSMDRKRIELDHLERRLAELRAEREFEITHLAELEEKVRRAEVALPAPVPKPSDRLGADAPVQRMYSRRAGAPMPRWVISLIYTLVGALLIMAVLWLLQHLGLSPSSGGMKMPERIGR